MKKKGQKKYRIRGKLSIGKIVLTEGQQENSQRAITGNLNVI